MNITLELPENIIQKLKEKADLEEETLEETILRILLVHFCLDNPQARAEAHVKLSQKYLNEGEEFLAKGDYVQASEKGWGTASQIVKAIAAKRRKRLKSHSELNEYLDLLSEERKDPELNRLWRSALALHQNFYESWLPPRSVEQGIEDMKRLLGKLKEV